VAGRGSRSVLTVSHLYPSPAFPGLGTFVRDEVVELARRNTMTVVAPLRGAQTVREVPEMSEEDGIRVVRPRFPGIPVGGRIVEPRLWAARLRPLLRRLYTEMDCDLVHAYFALPDGFAAARFASREGVPFVLTLLGSDVLVFGSKRVARVDLRHTVGKAGAIIAVSSELAARAVELGAAETQVHVIPVGVPYRRIEARQEARRRLGLDEGTVCILWVGRLVSVKQPLDAIRAFAELLGFRSNLSAVLVMIGEGPLRAQATELVRSEGLDGRVRLVGYPSREEVWSWQCASDLQINSSSSEGTPVAVLEALGAGTPVAAYPLPGVAAALDAVGGGRLARESTPQALAAAVSDELAEARDRDRIAAEARARYDIAFTARAIEDVYASVR
jgi:teichuronic acid biosynthesis glycosyltransferase TuaC